MDIILDTNIYQADFSLKGNEINAMTAYLSKTDRKLIVPYVVAQEVILNYKQDLKRSIKILKESSSQFHSCAITEEYRNLSAGINALEGRNSEKFEKEASDYFSFVKSKINCLELLELPKLSLENIVERAIKKAKPFKQSGEGFKDVVIWESILAYCEGNNLESIIFISNNSSDFGKAELTEALQGEAKARNIVVYYYNSLEALIVDRFHSIQDLELDLTHIDKYELQTLCEYYLNRNNLLLSKFFAKRSKDRVTYHDMQGVESLNIDEIQDWVVMDVATDFKYVQCTLSSKIGIVCIGDHYNEFVNQISGDLDYDFNQDLERLETNCVIEISMRLEEGFLSEMQVLSLEFTT